MAEEQRFEFQYRRSEEYKRLPVSGIIGGQNPQGLIVTHIFFEASRLADVQHGTVNELGALQMDADPPVRVLDREILATLLLQPHIARSVAQWLIGHADAIEQAQRQAAQNNPA